MPLERDRTMFKQYISQLEHSGEYVDESVDDTLVQIAKKYGENLEELVAAVMKAKGISSDDVPDPAAKLKGRLEHCGMVSIEAETIQSFKERLNRLSGEFTSSLTFHNAQEHTKVENKVSRAMTREKIVGVALGISELKEHLDREQEITSSFQTLDRILASFCSISTYSSVTHEKWKILIEAFTKHRHIFQVELERFNKEDLAEDANTPVVPAIQLCGRELEHSLASFLHHLPTTDIQHSVTNMENARNQIIATTTASTDLNRGSSDHRQGLINHAGDQHDVCLPGRRVHLLAAIDRWARDTASPSRIYCLADVAGTGKSTIANHLSHQWEQEGRLAAKFFFSRGNGLTANASDLCIGIAQNLVLKFDALRPELKENLKDKDVIPGSIDQ
ncbi:hypothetical protein FRC14_007974, partial [Serendipita sp. 396]